MFRKLVVFAITSGLAAKPDKAYTRRNQSALMPRRGPGASTSGL